MFEIKKHNCVDIKYEELQYINLAIKTLIGEIQKFLNSCNNLYLKKFEIKKKQVYNIDR